MALSVTVWDGAGVIGGNKVLLEADGARVFLDFGTAFAKMDEYFDEFLGARPNRGLLDLVELDVLPPLDGIYRRDLYPGDAAVEERMRRKPDHRALEVDAVLVSHAHVDHNGAVAVLREDIPIYASAMTAFIAKAIQDCGGLHGDLSYVRRRGATKDGLIQVAPRTPARHRPHYLFEPLDAAALDFWGRREGKLALDPVPPALASGSVAGLPLRSFPVDHSVMGSTACALETSAGWVIYTGDLRVHGSRGQLTRRFAEAVRELRPRILVTEGTHVGDLAGGSEGEVRERALDAVRAAPGFVAADFQPRHVERLMTFRDVAREAGRKLAVTVRDAYLLDAMHCLDPSVPTVDGDDALVLYVRGKLRAPAWEQTLLSRFAARRIDAREVHAHAEGYVLALSFYDLAELVEIDPPSGGIWIHSTSEAYDEEGVVNWGRLKRWLAHFGIRLVGDWEQARAGVREAAGFHASGHANGPQLQELIELIRPEVLVPVHTQQPEWFRRFADRMRVELPERGRPIGFDRHS